MSCYLNLDGLPPVFAGIVQAHADIGEMRRAAYVSGLIRHTWGGTSARTQSEFAALQELQREVDPNCALWDRHAPTAFRRGQA